MGGIGSFQVHPGHLFEGLLIVDNERAVLALCGCGVVLGRAEAAFAPCPECGNLAPSWADVSCRRCGGSGRVVDHSALEWQRSGDGEGAGW